MGYWVHTVSKLENICFYSLHIVVEMCHASLKMTVLMHNKSGLLRIEYIHYRIGPMNTAFGELQRIINVMCRREIETDL
jgi:hypothetical protein